MKLDFKNAKKEIVEKDQINSLKKEEDIIVFGAGESGDWIVNLLRENGIIPKCVCDNSKRKHGKEHNGLPIISFQSAITMYPNAVICIASMWREDILKQIKAYNPRIKTYDFLTSMAWETTNKMYVSTEVEYIKDHLKYFKEIYNELSDVTSKKTLCGILNYRLTRDRQYLESIKSSETIYVDKKIIKMDKEKICILDGGAYDGDTAKCFIEQWGGKKTANLCIHCYEADYEICNLLRAKQPLFLPHKIIVHHAALWSSSGNNKLFESSGLSGKIRNNKAVYKENEFKIITEKIDDLNFGKVDFIKLDIEGAERECLKGARETIEKYHPILAICAYHLQDDLLVLYDFIKSLNCKYEIILRHYQNSSGDTVLYGIPRA